MRAAKKDSRRGGREGGHVRPRPSKAYLGRALREPGCRPTVHCRPGDGKFRGRGRNSSRDYQRRRSCGLHAASRSKIEELAGVDGQDGQRRTGPEAMSNNLDPSGVVHPTVSVIMPAYKSKAYLEEAIRSVIDQTFQDWELVVVDDASSDENPRSCRLWLARSRGSW